MVIMENGRPRLASNGGHINQSFDVLEWGYRLAETDIGVDEKDPKGLWNAKGWKQFVEHIADPHRRAVTAIMLENCRSEFGRLDEVTRTSSLGTFDKWIFPVISNMSENDVIDQLVSLQPMAGPVSQVVYMDIVTAKSKGQTPAGSPMWRALQGAVDRFDDSDEMVTNEALGATAAAAGPRCSRRTLTPTTRCSRAPSRPSRPTASGRCGPPRRARSRRPRPRGPVVSYA